MAEKQAPATLETSDKAGVLIKVRAPVDRTGTLKHLDRYPEDVLWAP